MAKTYRNLWPHVVAWDNLVAAYRACRRRKRFKPEAAAFDFCWETQLLALQRELNDGRYAPGPYRHFYIHEPKRRKISAAPFRDRVVHHAVVRVLEPLYEARFVHDSYACRRGKGTHRAILRVQRYLRQFRFCLKTDIVKFFPSVDHEILVQVLQRRIRDECLLDLITTIIASGRGVLEDEAPRAFFPGDDLLALLRPRGLPIGNLTSQFFANVFLDPLDHFIKEQLRVPAYVRYSDDLVLLGNCKGELWQWRDAIAQELTKFRLRLHSDKTQVQPCSRPLKVLGFVLSRNGRRLQQSALGRFNRRLRRLRWLWNRGAVSAAEIRSSLQGWQIHASFANSTGVRRDIWRRVRFRRRT